MEAVVPLVATQEDTSQEDQVALVILVDISQEDLVVLVDIFQEAQVDILVALLQVALILHLVEVLLQDTIQQVDWDQQCLHPRHSV